jgi:hypothetical protein
VQLSNNIIAFLPVYLIASTMFFYSLKRLSWVTRSITSLPSTVYLI